MRTTRGFDAQFFARLEEKQARGRTWQGRIAQWCESEIQGVAVWRLVGSSAAGSVFPALMLACCLTAPAKHAAPAIPEKLLVLAPVNQRKFWEEAAWKSPSKSIQIALLDPQFNLNSKFKIGSAA